MTAPGALMDHDVAAVREETAAGKQVTVWFTAEAVGVPVGGSAKVLSVGEVAEGDFIQVRPVGSKDTMYCSPGELTRTRPPRRRAAVAEPVAPPARRSRAPRPAPEVAAPAAVSPAAVSPAAVSPAAVSPAAVSPAPAAVGPPPAAGPSPRAAAPPAPRRRVPRTGEITVSLAANAGGEWTVEVLAGTKRVVPRTPVQPGDVAAAARSLPPAVAAVVEASLEGARERQRDRVEQLRAELDAAQRALEQLGAGG